MNKKKNTILVVDNDSQTYKILNLVLDHDDYEVVECTSGRQAIGMCVSLKPDIALLEFGMQDLESAEIIKAMREWSKMPVIILSERHSNDDVVRGLDMGADDYVVKPFNVDVLRARINASLRKSVVQENGEAELVNGPLRINLVRHEVFMGDQQICLTPKEYNLLRYFIVHKGKMLGHRQILSEVWGPAHCDDIQYLRVFVAQIRDKIETDPANPQIITTELGIGYRMEILQLPPANRQGELGL
jgi:two-component system KDP operon response regulator KdpE